jgi:hypothetical protein
VIEIVYLDGSAGVSETEATLYVRVIAEES